MRFIIGERREESIAAPWASAALLIVLAIRGVLTLDLGQGRQRVDARQIATLEAALLVPAFHAGKCERRHRQRLQITAARVHARR